MDAIHAQSRENTKQYLTLNERARRSKNFLE